MASKKEVLVLAGDASALLATIRTAREELTKLQGLAASIQVGGGSVPKIIAGQSGAEGLRTYYDAQAGNAERSVAAANSRSTARSMADIDANAASPGTTPESRKDAARARAAASSTESTATWGQRWQGLTPQQVTREMSSRKMDAVAASELGAGIRERNLTTAQGLFKLAQSRQALRVQAFADTKTARGGLNEEEWAEAQAKRFSVRTVETNTTLGMRTGLEGARTTTLVARKDLADAKYRLQGGSQADLIAARQADRGATQAEMIDKRREAAREREEIRKEKRRDRVADRAAAKQDAISDRMGANWMHALPGARLWGTAQRMIPGAASMGASAATWGQQHIVAPGWGGLGSMGAGTSMGIAGLAGVAAAGLIGVIGGGMIAGEYGVGQLRDRFAPSVGRLRNNASALRLGAGAGGVDSNAAFLRSGAMDRLAALGIGSSQIASSYAALVAGRGESDSSAFARNAARDGTEEALMWGLDGGTVGQMLGAGGKVGLGAGLAGAGLRGAALQESYAFLAGRAGKARSHGIQYDTEAYAASSRQLSTNPAFGGGRYGGDLATQRLSTIGDSSTDGIEAALASLADMAVLAEAAAGGGDLTDIIHRKRGMTPQQRGAAQGRQLGAGNAKYGLVGKGFSPDQANNLVYGADPGAATPGYFADPLGAAQEQSALALDRAAAASGSAAERVVQMDANTQKQLGLIAANLELLNAYLNVRKGALAGAQKGWLSWVGSE